LRLRNREFLPGRLLVMAIVNRTQDSFYQPGLTWEDTAAMDRVHQVVAEGADIVDIGGVPAKPGSEVSPAEEIRRTAAFIATVRAAYPDLVISADTWRHEVGRAACEAGADLLNDTWGGWDPRWRRWPRNSTRAWSARTPAACRRGPGRSASPIPT
jgi:dihydropteroate synthase